MTLVERQTVGHGQDLETVFALFPVIQEGDTVLFESYARIKHLASKKWLHLDRGELVAACVREACKLSFPCLVGLLLANHYAEGLLLGVVPLTQFLEFLHPCIERRAFSHSGIVITSTLTPYPPSASRLDHTCTALCTV